LKLLHPTNSLGSPRQLYCCTDAVKSEDGGHLEVKGTGEKGYYVMVNMWQCFVLNVFRTPTYDG
jgi:hypothetical protein